jgi:hypothetical protein
VFILSRRVSMYLLLWVLVTPLYLVLVRSPAYAQPSGQAVGVEQQDLPCPGGPLQDFVTGTSESGVPSPEAAANGEPLTGRWWDAGSRSYWHCHGGGQYVIVMEGEGRAQKRGERMRDLHVGDIEFALPGVEHWHGASPLTGARHINQSLAIDGGSGVFWMEEVSPADYSGNGIGISSRMRYLETGER